MFPADNFDAFICATVDGFAVFVLIAMVVASFFNPFGGGYHRACSLRCKKD
jgi:hypothetical protein